MANIFKGIGDFFKKVFNPSSWFKMPEIKLPEMPKPQQLQVTSPVADAPKAGMVEAAERPEVAGFSKKKSGLSMFKGDLTPTLQQIIGLASTGMPTGMLIPAGGSRGK